ncbi:MAG: hypothetical protein CMJ94_09680 [Planctomycetes bacterium]|nr:hypothetical protein [Planctomycetota bacterium]
MRERAKQKEASRSADSQPSQAKKPAPRRDSAPAPSQSKVSPARRRAASPRPSAPAAGPAAGGPSRKAEGSALPGWFAEHRTPVLATIGLLAILGLLKFWPSSNEPIEAGNGGEPAAVSNEPYAVLVATYAYDDAKKRIAQATGRAVRDLFPDHTSSLKLITYPQKDPDLIELWIGEAEDPSDLQDLLRQVQESTVPTDKNNPRPFVSARIERRRHISTN